MDWKDALSSLRNTLPEEEPVKQVIEEKEEETKGNKIQLEPLRVLTDRKGRNGKTATLVEGFTIPQEEVERIAANMKRLMGVGGSVRNGEILIQGDFKEKVVKFLNGAGFKTK